MSTLTLARAGTVLTLLVSLYLLLAPSPPGASLLPDWRVCRVVGPALDRLAAS